MKGLPDMTTMLIGYARTSTRDPKAGLEAQLRDLEKTGCNKVFVEDLSSVAATRPQLEAALEWVREGDVLVVKGLTALPAQWPTSWRSRQRSGKRASRFVCFP